MFQFNQYLNHHSPGYVIEIFNRGERTEQVIGNKVMFPQAEPVSADTLYDIASLTKVFTATLVYMAAEEGKITLTTPITDIEPRFTQLKNITVLDLLSHHQNIWTDGYLGNAANQADFYRILYSAYVKDPTPTYVDAHYIILGVLLEKIYGCDLAALCQKRIFDPLKLKDTTFDPAPERCASNNYEHTAQGVIEDILPGIIHDNKARRMKVLGMCAGHAGIFMTGKDLLTFLESFLNGGLLKKETIAMMFDHEDINAINYKALAMVSDYKEINAMAADAVCRGASVPLLRTHNNMGIRYRNAITSMNDVPDRAGENAVVFSGYTGPMFCIDPDRQIIVVIMCNVMHDTRLSREERKRLTAEMMEGIYKDLIIGDEYD